MIFYFYDLETSGFSPRYDRIMQFAGQRTDKNLNSIGEPDNFLVKITTDVLPEPGAVLVHGITPQKTLDNGISEYELAKYLTSQVFTKNTIAVGYNNIRFDNEFIRFLFWRNFHDAYEWSWKDGCSTWDMLDVVRMTRALRPEGIEWPFAPDGKPTNSLEYLTSVNGLDHVDAHDAMSDVRACIAVAKLLKQKQPKLFDYLLNIRSKNKVAPLVAKAGPILYTSGRYPADFLKTTVASMVVEKSDKSGALMYDLRIDPDEFKDMSDVELAQRWRAWGDDVPYFPVKLLSYNRCPAIAPINVLDSDAIERLQLHKEVIDAHYQKLQDAKGFGEKLLKANDLMWSPRQPEMVIDEQKVDSQLYDGFIKDDDKTKMSVVRAAEPGELSNIDFDFRDERLKSLFPLYKARNFPSNLSSEERKVWDNFRRRKLFDGNPSVINRFLNQIEELETTAGLDEQKRSWLKDLRDYAQSIKLAA